MRSHRLLNTISTRITRMRKSRLLPVSSWFAFKALAITTAAILAMTTTLHGLGLGTLDPISWSSDAARDSAVKSDPRSAGSSPVAASIGGSPLDTRQLAINRDREGNVPSNEGGLGMDRARTGSAFGSASASGSVSGVASGSASGPAARIAYLVMTSGEKELPKTKRLLKAIYDPSNLYLIHVDRKSEEDVRHDLVNFIADRENMRMLEPALDVSWGGYTITLTAIFAICSMVQWSEDWDFFINLSASDFPLLPQAEIKEVLGEFSRSGLNLVDGSPLSEKNRVEVMIDDQGLYREAQTWKAGRPLMMAKARPPPSKSMFTVFKGEFWHVLHRSFCQYLEASPDNVARSLQAYFSGFRISDESYFQTLLCHPQAPSFPVYKDNMRFVSWPEVSEGYYVLHPDPITISNVALAMESGALFARKFDLEESKEAYEALEESLGSPNPERLRRSKKRLAMAAEFRGREAFCEVPSNYSIQEVLSRPPKMPHKVVKIRQGPERSERLHAGVSQGKGPRPVVQTAKSSPRMRDVTGRTNHAAPP